MGFPKYCTSEQGNADAYKILFRQEWSQFFSNVSSKHNRSNTVQKKYEQRAVNSNTEIGDIERQNIHSNS